MVLWRVSNCADLLGLESVGTSARWHNAGRPVVYLAENPSAALLEVLVQLKLGNEDAVPDSYQILKIETEDSLRIEEISTDTLPSGWESSEQITRQIGDGWLNRAPSALLRVPSVITPETWNWVLNPRHPDAVKVRIKKTEKHPYDPRLIHRDQC